MHQTYNICMTEYSYFPCTSTYSSTLHNTNRKHGIHHFPYANIQLTSTLQGSGNLLSSATAAAHKHSHRPQTVTTIDIKTNMLSKIKNTYTKSTPNQIHCNTHTHTSPLQLHPHTHHVVTHGFVDSTAGRMDGEAGWWTTSGINDNSHMYIFCKCNVVGWPF